MLLYNYRNEKRGDEMDFGEMLLGYRAKHNLSQKQLAEIIGVRQEMVSKYESGEHVPTRKNKLIYENKMKEREAYWNV